MLKWRLLREMFETAGRRVSQLEAIYQVSFTVTRQELILTNAFVKAVNIDSYDIRGLHH